MSIQTSDLNSLSFQIAEAGAPTSLTTTGSGPATLSGGVLNIPAAPGNAYLFGSGSDGNVTITSTITLTRDMYYNNLTISGSGVLVCQGYRVFVNGILDISSASAGAIIATSGSLTGSSASGGTGGGFAAYGAIIGVSQGALYLGAGTQPPNALGGNGGSSAVGSAAVNVPMYSAAVSWGATNAGIGGRGGASASSLGGAAGAVTSTAVQPKRGFDPFNTVYSGGFFGWPSFSGISGSGGSGGNSGTGGGGGASGVGGFYVIIFANTIFRGTNTNTGIISAKGGTGGNGGNAAGSGTNGASGGGGGAGGSGGFVYLVTNSLTGSTITNAIDVSGGAGGAGGNGITGATNPGLGGNGGANGYGGVAMLINLGLGTITTLTDTAGPSNAGGSGTSGLTGGVGATAVTVRVNL